MTGRIRGAICYDTSCPYNKGYVCFEYNPDTDSFVCEEGYDGE